jgi:hypothetical protein
MATVVACGGDGGGTTAPQPTRPVAWVDNVWTQPVPAWGSPVRLNLPLPLASIVFGAGGGLGAFGAHEGGHVEGLNHIWLPTAAPMTVRTWAPGTVTKIEDVGGGEYFITVDYGQGLVGKHLDVQKPLVKVGDVLREGDAVAIGVSGETMLIDNNRSDGERTGGAMGSPVSPFDYLTDDVKAAVIARYVAEVVEPYFKKGLSVGAQRPWEPRLTNKMLFHGEHKGTSAGEWLATNKGWSVIDPVYFDVMTIFDVTNEYGHFQRFEMMDHDWSMPGNKNGMSGSFVTDAPGRVVFTEDHGATYYGLYSVDENGARARLTIEWNKGAYPASISSSAAVYVERAPIYLGGDAQALGLIK